VRAHVAADDEALRREQARERVADLAARGRIELGGTLPRMS
jgi:hypothetical protein